jgi:hypothetical protein
LEQLEAAVVCDETNVVRILQEAPQKGRGQALEAARGHIVGVNKQDTKGFVQVPAAVLVSDDMQG